MKPERWRQLDKLFHSALEREPAERAAFLDESCAGDESLRRQVEALLAAHEEAGSFIERPAMEVEARGLAADEGTTEAGLAAGESFSHYRIIAPLGSGGMGQVYLAQDMALGRKVALKLLPPDFTRDRERVRRFQQEARAASALNHPNIITIHEIGQAEEKYFIATEFIDGETLRQHVRGPQTQTTSDSSRTSGTLLKLRDILNIAIQTADALASAHEAGVVHRDIKPENIMVRRRDGYVKVLDFGLAKLTEGRSTTVDTEAPTRAQFQTSAGMVMGTASYMSPEQARGQAVDGRSDIFSLGVVLYEMVAGCAPFAGETPTDVVASILSTEPPPLARYLRGVPEGLEWITTKALAKEKKERYQTAKDMEVDLRRLKQQLEFAAELERSARPVVNREVTEKRSEVGSAIDTLPESATLTQEAEARRTSSAEYVIGEIKRHRAGAMVVFATLVIATAGIAFLVYRFAGQTRSSVKPPLQAMRITKLTNTGKVEDAAISPDGRYVAYAEGDGSLWLRQVETTSNVQIVPPAHAYLGLTFSPDGNYIYYNMMDPKGAVTDLYQMPVLGGLARKLVVGIDSVITFSPDSKRFAFVRINLAQAESVLVVAKADGTAEQKLAVRKSPDFFTPEWIDSMAWSPDGKVIACPTGSTDAGVRYMTVDEVRVEDGMVRPITSQRWWHVRRMAWLRDGSGLVFAAQEQGSSPSQIWYLSYPGGDAHRITNDVNDYSGGNLTADSNDLVTVQSDYFSNIWIAPSGDTSRATQIPSNKGDGGEGIAWTPDGKIVYTSPASGNLDLWIMNQDGSGPKQLTADAGNNRYPVVSADGRYIVFMSERAGARHIWRIDGDGGNPRQLTKGGGESDPAISPDGQWVVYTGGDWQAAGAKGLWKVPINGGEAVQVSDKGGDFHPVVSPDGKWIACSHLEDRFGTAIYPFAGGEPIRVLDMWTWNVFRWTANGRALAYMDQQDSNIIVQPIDGSMPTKLTNFKTMGISTFDLSRDGKWLALVRGTGTSDVVLISGIRNQQ